VLEQAGLAASAIDGPPADAPQFESEALRAVVAPQIRPGDRVLIVRGASLHNTTDGQGSAANGWRPAAQPGRTGRAGGVYSRQCPATTPALQERLAAHCAARDLWLFSSSEAIATCNSCAAQDWSRQRALTTPPASPPRHAARALAMFWTCKPDVEVCLRR
jgi:uroporphyrinogen-III synthase